jgi:signal transduction histidine kinase
LQEYVEADIEFLQADPDVFGESKVALAISCREKSTQSSGFLILGRKKSTPVFSQEDIDLLRTVASHLGLAIEHIRLQQNLILEQAEAQRLEELNRLKSFFVSSVSHELQTPLTSIKMFAELLRTKAKISEGEKQEYLEIIEGESERLTRLIENVLDYSRIERGVKKYEFSHIDIREVIEKVVQSMMFQIRQQGFRLHTQIPDDPLIMRADPDAIHEALVNLISNSIKYSTSRKVIELTVKAENAQVRFSVQDYGIGIAGEEQDKIFDTFYRSNDKYVQSSGGAGLGLSIVSHIVKAHQGRIHLDSSPGKGSTFTLILPMESKQ